MVGSHQSGEALLFYRIEIKIIACDFPNKKQSLLPIQNISFQFPYDKYSIYST